MDEKGRMIATILLPFETSIPTAFINCHSLRLLQWISTSFTHCLFNLLWCDANAPMAIQPA